MSKSSGPGKLSHTLMPTLKKQRQGQVFKVILSDVASPRLVLAT